MEMLMCRVSQSTMPSGLHFRLLGTSMIRTTSFVIRHTGSKRMVSLVTCIHFLSLPPGLA